MARLPPASSDGIREIAEIDRGHHHEALFMAEYELKRAQEIETQISAAEEP
jgi:hypothetical protein